MPYNEVMSKFGKGQLHSGSKSGPVVKNPKQAVAIMENEKQKADAGDSEYAAKPKQKMALKGLKHAISKKKPVNDHDGDE